MKRSLAILPLLALVAACSQADTTSGDVPAAETKEAATADASATSEGANAPRIGANVAPGVAFTHAYNFALPQTAIADVQSRHAALCESLTLRHCRVSGMEYDRSDDGSVSATLAFKLDPALTGSFARDATDLVEKADGRLADSRISGEDVGTGIVANDKGLAAIDAELAKIDAQLKIPNLAKDVRGRLVERGNELRDERQSLSGEREDKVESLATTPVSFAYASSEGVLGMDPRNPIARATATSWWSMKAMIEVVMTLGGALAPWALLGGGIWWIIRRLRRKPVVTAE
jgi:hypothetical protein